MNDLSMFKIVKHGVAVGNAIDDVKNQVPYLTGSVVDGGVGDFLRKEILYKGEKK